MEILAEHYLTVANDLSKENEEMKDTREELPFTPTQQEAEVHDRTMEKIQEASDGEGEQETRDTS